MPKSIPGILFAAVLALAAPTAFAQHGGHGGGGGGGHAGGGSFGGGGGFHSAPAPHYSASVARPPAVSRPMTNFAPRSYALPTGRIAPPPPGSPSGMSAARNYAPTPGWSHFGGTPYAASPAPPSSRTLGMTGFPPAEGSQRWPVQPPASSSGVRTFSGEGRDLWQESSQTPRNVIVSPNASRALGLGRAPEVVRPIPGPIGPRRGFPPGRGYGSGYPGYYPGFGFFGFYDSFYGCDPFWGTGWNCADSGYYANSISGPANAPGTGEYDNAMPLPYDSGENGVYQQGQPQEEAPPIYDQQPPDTSQQNLDAEKTITVLYLKDGTVYAVNDYWLADGRIYWGSYSGYQNSFPADELDLQKTVDVNASRGLAFTLRPGSPSAPDAAPSPNNPAQPPAPEAPQQPPTAANI